MPLSPEEKTELVRRAQLSLAEQAESVRTASGALWDRLAVTVKEDWDGHNVFRDASNQLWERARVGAVRTSTARNALLTDLPTTGITADMVPGAPPSTARAFSIMWRRLGDGYEWEDAFASGRAMFIAAHVDALYQAARRSGDVWAGRVGYRGGWQRVLVGTSCEWCALVSTQIYYSAASASFGHDNCDCEVAPYQGWAPSGVIRSDRYETLKSQKVADRIYATQQMRRTAAQAESAEARSVAAMAEARRETDPQRRERLLDRARHWDERAQHYRVRVAENTAWTERFPKPDSHTGYVNPDGSPAPRPAA